jgi:hypothetical protein
MTTVFPAAKRWSGQLPPWVRAAVGNPMNERLLVAVGPPKMVYRGGYVGESADRPRMMARLGSSWPRDARKERLR